MLASIIDWLRSISDNIVQIPIKIGAFISDLKTALEGYFADLAQDVLSLPSQIGYYIKKVVTAVEDLPEKIGEFVKSLFVPDDGFIEDKIEEIKNSFLGLGSQSYDMTKLFDKEQPFEDIKCTIMGLEVTIIKFDAVDTALGYFRPIIQGFMYLMLVIYNLNQFFAFIGQEGIAVGSVFTGALLKGGGKSDN